MDGQLPRISFTGLGAMQSSQQFKATVSLELKQFEVE